MDDLVAFIEARLADDEADARSVEGDGDWDCPSTGVLQLGGIEDMDGLVLAPRGVAYHAARHDPSRVLRDVAAKRRLLKVYREAKSYYDANRSAPAGELHGLWTAVSLLALPYDSHPDFRPERSPTDA